MYQDFNVLSISTSLMEKKVRIEFSLDVNEETVTLDTIVLSDKASGRIIDAVEYHVARNVIDLELDAWPVPNTEYLLKIQKGITSIVDDELPDSLRRNVVFKSEITSVVEVTSPADHEEIEDISITWKSKEVRSSENLVNSYYLEISTDTAFYNIVKHTEVHGKQEVRLSGLEDRQYFLRIRAQENGQYGRWSDTTSFVMKAQKTESNESFEEDDSPVFEEELRVITAPANGEALKSFLIEFDDDLDVDSIEDIVVIRRPI